MGVTTRQKLWTKVIDCYIILFIHVVLHLGSNIELRKKQKQMEKELDQEAEVLNNSYYYV